MSGVLVGQPADVLSVMSPTSDSFALLASWRAVLRANDLAESTLHQYSYGMFRLLESLNFEVHLLDMTEGHIARFLAGLGRRSTSKSEYIKGIRSFYGWTVARGYLLTSPMGMIKPRKPQPCPPERFEYDELVRLLTAAAWRDPRRAWAILGCLGLGTRRNEFVNIRIRDINWDRMVSYTGVWDFYTASKTHTAWQALAAAKPALVVSSVEWQAEGTGGDPDMPPGYSDDGDIYYIQMDRLAMQSLMWTGPNTLKHCLNEAAC